MILVFMIVYAIKATETYICKYASDGEYLCELISTPEGPIPLEPVEIDRSRPRIIRLK